MSKPIDIAAVTIRLPVTFAQLRAINRRAGLSAWDGKARSDYIVGCALSEPHDQLMAERERSRRLSANGCAQRSKRSAPKARSGQRKGPPTEGGPSVAAVRLERHRCQFRRAVVLLMAG